MRKLVSLFLVCLLSVGLFACSASQEENSVSINENSESIEESSAVSTNENSETAEKEQPLTGGDCAFIPGEQVKTFGKEIYVIGEKIGADEFEKTYQDANIDKAAQILQIKFDDESSVVYRLQEDGETYILYGYQMFASSCGSIGGIKIGDSIEKVKEKHEDISNVFDGKSIISVIYVDGKFMSSKDFNKISREFLSGKGQEEAKEYYSNAIVINYHIENEKIASIVCKTYR